MTRIHIFAASLLAFSGAANAADLVNVSGTLGASDPIQSGRLGRNGVPSNWTAAKNFPGTTNTSIFYRYRTFAVSVGASSFVQVIIDDPNAALFASAYLNSYN